MNSIVFSTYCCTSILRTANVFYKRFFESNKLTKSHLQFNLYRCEIINKSTQWIYNARMVYVKKCKKLFTGFATYLNCFCNCFCRYKVYHDKTGSLDLEKFPPTSSCIGLHIRCAYFQAYLWYHCPFTESIEIKPEDFGYICNENEQLVPEITNNFTTPESFPKPCSCLKCARKTICGCRKMSIMCCKYCKCNAGEDCQNLED